MTAPAIVVNSATLTNPNGAASDYILYSLYQFDGTLYGGGWLDGNIATPSNTDGWGLDRIYVSSSPTLDDFHQAAWTDGEAPGTWNDANGVATLSNEVANGDGSYSLVPYYGPGEPFNGPLYYMVNDPVVVAEGALQVMYVTALPNQNEYPATTTPEPNGNPGYQLGWNSLAWATSSDNGQTWTWQGAVPLTRPDGTPLLAPVTTPFPTDPTVTYEINSDGNETPAAVYNATSGLDLWYVHLATNRPVLWLSREDTQGAWAVPQACYQVTGSGTAELNVINPDVALADDGSGTLWMVAPQWYPPNTGDLVLFYSSPTDGANQGVAWHPWDGAAGVLMTMTNPAFGLFNFMTPSIVSVGNGSLDIDYSLPGSAAITNISQVNESFVLPCFGSGTRVLTSRGELPVEALRVGALLPTRLGQLARVRWIGHREVDTADVLPIRIRAHAFGADRPHRDLWLSPDHAIYIDNALMPVRWLLNGATVTEAKASGLGYWHIELSAHDVLLADGLPCESYLDTGNRAALTGVVAQRQIMPRLSAGHTGRGGGGRGSAEWVRPA